MPCLFALNAETGKPVENFGTSGRADIKEGLGDRSKDLYVVTTTPGIVYNDLIIIGSRVSEEAGGAPGYIRAFDIPSGKLAWTFKTIPNPGEFGYDTWPPDAWKTAGGANSWSGMSLDEAPGLFIFQQVLLPSISGEGTGKVPTFLPTAYWRSMLRQGNGSGIIRLYTTTFGTGTCPPLRT